jgi:hypothetical protein
LLRRMPGQDEGGNRAWSLPAVSQLDIVGSAP